MPSLRIKSDPDHPKNSPRDQHMPQTELKNSAADDKSLCKPLKPERGNLMQTEWSIKCPPSNRQSL